MAEASVKAADTRRSSSSMDQSSASGTTNNAGKTVSPVQHNFGKGGGAGSGVGGGGGGGGRRRHRRAGKGGEKHRRKWKPYDKLSWEEKRLLGEKEALTAEKRREDALRLGHPVAPFNTTQFIMDEHSGGKGITPRMVASRSLNASGGCPTGSGSGHGSGFCSQQDTPNREETGDDNDVYFEREYNAALETVRAERLQSMNAQQLRGEVLRLEVEIDALNKNIQTRLEEKDVEIAELRSEIARQRELLARFSELATTELTTTTTNTTSTTVKINGEPVEQQEISILSQGRGMDQSSIGTTEKSS